MGHRYKQNRSGADHLPKLIGGIFLIFLGIMIGAIINSPSSEPVRGEEAGIPVFSMAVQEIAGEFHCGCGSCDDLELASCTCPTALKEKTMIKDLLERGYDRSTITATIESTYGGRKT